MKAEYNLITPFLDELLKKGYNQRGINEALNFIIEEQEDFKEREVLIKDNIRNEFITFKWTNKKKYETSIKTLKKAQSENKCFIIKDEIINY